MRRMDDAYGSTGRSMGAGIILSLGAWLLVAGVTGLWIRGTFLDVDGFEKFATQLLSNEQVQQDIANATLEEAIARSGDRIQEHEAEAQEALDTVVDSGQLDEALVTAMVGLHQAILADGEQEVDLSKVIEPVQAELDARGVDVDLPQLDRISMGTAEPLQMLRDAADTARTVTTWLPIVGLLVIGGGLLLSDRRLRSLRWLGWSVAFSAGSIALFSFVGRMVARAALEQGGMQGAGFDAVWGALMNGLITRMTILAVGAIVVAVVAWVIMAQRNKPQPIQPVSDFVPAGDVEAIPGGGLPGGLPGGGLPGMPDDGGPGGPIGPTV